MGGAQHVFRTGFASNSLSLSLSLPLCRIAKKLIRNHLPEWDLQWQHAGRAGYMNTSRDVFDAREARKKSSRGKKRGGEGKKRVKNMEYIFFIGCILPPW